MRRRLTLTKVVFWLGSIGLAVMLVIGVTGLAPAGEVDHPYATRAVGAAVSQQTGNVVGSVTFDQRGFDTLGEELILLTAAVGTILLLRRMRSEDDSRGIEHGFGPEDVFEAVRLLGIALLPVTLLVGGYIVVHGTSSPGGGFQGGVVLATGIHLAYLAGDYHVLERLRPVPVFDVAEAVGAGAYVVIGIAALLTSGSFLANTLPLGTLGEVGSGGSVLALNIAVGLEVGSALVLLIAKFLDQALLVRSEAGEPSA